MKNETFRPTAKTALIYGIGTFLLSYVCWGILIIFIYSNITEYGTPLSMPLYLIGGWSPTIVACIVLIRRKEVSGIRRIIKDSFCFKQKPAIYGMIIVLTAITYLFPALTGHVIISEPFYIAIAALPLMLLGGGLEEVGWRYILQPVLEEKMPFTVASFVMGLIWSFWHLPLFYVTGTPNNLYMTFPVFAINLLGLSSVYAFLRKYGTGIWPCILFHCLNNALPASFSIEENLTNTILTSLVLIVLVTASNLYLQKRDTVS